jgi:hypothetical protein
MWEPRRLRSPWASSSCYRDSFTFMYILFRTQNVWALVGLNAIESRKYLPKFRRNFLFPSSRKESTPHSKDLYKYRNIWRHIPDDDDPSNNLRESLVSHDTNWIPPHDDDIRGLCSAFIIVLVLCYSICLLLSLFHYSITTRSWGRSSSPGRVKNFDFFIFSIPAMGTTQPPIQRVPGVLYPGVKRQGPEVDHWLQLVKARKRGSIHPLPHTSPWSSV